ncbi:MAG TPA: multicopper oxidase domain-containing protein [Desulfuromonadales bacterium]|nr:multicopper oxidase domain-containing protein [Desulfuromonadales bacterium]
MKKVTPIFIVLVAAAALTISGCDGGGGSSSLSATPSTLPPVTATDADGDGVVDTADAFPNDPAASVDTDGDGFPDAFNPNATDAQLDATTLTLDSFFNDPAASVDTDGDGKPDAFNPNAAPEQIAASPLVVDDDDDNDGLLDAVDAAPLLGIADIPTESPFGASPLDLGNGVAGDFEQKMIRFEEFGPESMPTAAAANWSPLPQPQNAQSGPVPAALESFLAQDGVAPFPTRLANVTEPSPWKSAIETYLGRPLALPAELGVAGPAEGRPSGEDWAHQSWDDLYPRKYYKTSVAQSRVNLGLRDARQRHGYALGEFGPGGLYHNVAGVPATEGTAAGIGIAFHPNLPVQAPNSIWTFDGTLPPKLLQVRYGEPVLMRNYNALPMDVTANNGFGRHTISTHEHNGHQPGESDGFAGAFFYPGQFYDYRWPLQLAGYSNNNNAAGAINFDASDSRAAIPCEAGETFKVLVNGEPVERACQDGRVMIPGDWRETMSTHWFHDHMLDHTAENVYKGNATMMNYYSALDRGNEAIDDGVNLRFPSGTALNWGNRDYDVNLVVADKAWDAATGQLWFNTAQHNGFLGDRMTVNFLYKPYFDVRARQYRFRFLNGSVSRIMAIGLVQEVQGDGGELPGPAGSGVSYNRVPFHMIGNDGNILEHAVAFDGVADVFHDGKPDAWKGQLPSQTIAERYDIIVDFSKHGIQPGDKLYFVNIMEHEDGKGTKSKVPMADIVSGKYNAIVKDGKWINGDPGVGKFMELRVHAYEGQDLSMNPAEYVAGGKKMIPLAIDRHDPALLTARHHTFEFVRSQAQGGHGTPWAIKVDGGDDNRADPQRISAIVHGDTEVWTIKTGRGWTHPVHIHFEEGVILTRGGKAPPEWETWARKDMYRIGPENDSTGIVEIAFRARDFLGHYVQHCHNTMHEDHAMLLRWDARNEGAVLIDTPMPTYDGVFFEPSFALELADIGDGTGPEQDIP